MPKTFDVFICERGSKTFLAVFRRNMLGEQHRERITRMFSRYKNLRFGQSDHASLADKRCQRGLARVNYTEISAETAGEILPNAVILPSREQEASRF